MTPKNTPDQKRYKSLMVVYVVILVELLIELCLQPHSLPYGVNTAPTSSLDDFILNTDCSSVFKLRSIRAWNILIYINSLFTNYAKKPIKSLTLRSYKNYGLEAPFCGLYLTYLFTMCTQCGV